MTLADWLREGRLRPHRAGKRDIMSILSVVERDISDAMIPDLSPDRRFATAYNAILQLATVVVRASGYRVAGQDHHWLTLQVLPELMPSLDPGRVDYFDGCRRKRNKVDYDSADVISAQEAEAFTPIVLKWLQDKRPDVSP